MAYITTDFMPLKMPVPGSREPAQIALLNENSQLIAAHNHSSGEGLPVAVLRSGVAGNRPTAGESGAFWFATDSGLASLDTGAAWVDFLTSSAIGQVLRDPVVRDSLRFGPEAGSTIDVTIQRAGAGALTLEGSPLLNQALGDARYLRTTTQLVSSVNGRTGVVVLTAADVGALTQASADNRYVNLTGDNLTGDLSIRSKFVTASLDAGNVLEWRTDGFYVPAPPASVDVNVAAADDTLDVAESPASNFLLNVRLSPDDGNSLSVRANGLFSTGVEGGGGLAGDPLADAKGDLFVASGPNAVGRLPVGAEGDTLIVSPLEPLGVRWAPPSEVPGNVLDQVTADALYVNVTGDSMSGRLTVTAGGIDVTGASAFSVAPTVGGSALLTQTAGDARYLTTGAADLAYVNVGGDTLTGALTLNVGGTGAAAAGDLRLRNNRSIAWRTAAGGADRTLSVNATDQFAFNGGLTVNLGTDPVSGLTLENSNTGAPYTIAFTRGGVARWQMGVIQGGEVGSNSGSDFFLGRYGDAGAWIEQGLNIRRSDGHTTIFSGLQIRGPLYWGDNAPTSIRAAQEGAVLVFRRNDNNATEFQMANDGNFTATSGVTAGNGWFVAGNNNVMTLYSPTSIQVNAGSTYFHPVNETVKMGHPSYRWAEGHFIALTATDITAANTIGANGGLVRSGNPAGTYVDYRFNGFSQNSGSCYIDAGPGSWMVLGTNSLGFIPQTHGGPSIGTNANRFSALWTTAGAINTSHVSAKENLSPLDPAEALAAFRRTTFWDFDYLGEEGYSKEGMSGRRGIVLGSDDHPADPYFALDGTSTEAMHYATGIAVALRGFMEEMDARLRKIEERLDGPG